MAIFATLPGLNLFSSLPTIPPPHNNPNTSSSPLPTPIPIPKYPPPRKYQKSQFHPNTYPDSKSNPKSFSPAFKTHHHGSKYYKPIKPGQVLTTTTTTTESDDDDDRSIVVGESGLSYRLPGAPFEFTFSYSETPKAQPLALREPAFLPFAPPSMARPWTGKAPLKKKKTRKIKLFDANDGENQTDEENNVKYYEMLKAYELGRYQMRPREEVLGASLSKIEIMELLRPILSSNKQVNLGRDGLTHNMLELIHTHWRRQPVCKVRCLGVPTVDMDNICRCLEDKTSGKIIHRVGGVVYLFRGRNYDHRKRPKLPVMLWKPAAPVYPKLIQEAPEGLTKQEADELRKKGKNLLPIRKLSKNGVYVTLVRDVKIAFEGCPIVKIDCKGMHPSDYKKLGAKLKELVPCVLLSYDDEQILMWRGKEWEPRYKDVFPSTIKEKIPQSLGNESVRYEELEEKKVRSSPSPRMMKLWERAIESGKALLLEKTNIGPDDLLEKVESFGSVIQATEHSYPVMIVSSEDGSGFSRTPIGYSTNDDSDDEEDNINDSFKVLESSVPLGLLPVDFIAKELNDNMSETDEK